ncbi:MAG TPA: hypothetical protein VEQ85_06720 [Lacipirellulaceae bacterium]|nr:hypothetical protein [Lacipirellulaceae bacterium]
MKIEPRLPQLPSLGELLEHPRVKGLVNRVNRSTLAQRAGGFLEEMRATLAERTGRGELPSLTHLAERLARRLLGEPAAAGPVINATGLLLGDPQLVPPLPEAALHAMVQTAGEFHRRAPAALRATERALCELAGGEAVCLTSSFEGAVMLAMAATAGGRDAAVGGAEADGPLDWQWLAARAGAVLRLGSGAGSGPGSGVVLRAPDAVDAPLDGLLQSRSPGAPLIDVAGIAGTLNPRDFGFDDVATVGERLAAGAEAVIIDGAGLLCGPRCGIVLGARAVVEPLAGSPLAALVSVEPGTLAALEAVLRLYRDESAPVVYQAPLWQLLSAPLANLEQRARRLARLVAEAPGVASAEARAGRSPWRQSGARSWDGPTWTIEVTPRSGSGAALAHRLARGPYPILARVSAAAVELDLRGVFPRWDQQLVGALGAASGDE